MSCPDDLALTRALDGELTVNAQAELDRHCGGCASCRGRRAHLAALRLALATTPLSEEPRFVDAVAQRLESRQRQDRRWRWAIPAAVALLVLLVIAMTRGETETFLARGGASTAGLEVVPTLVEGAGRRPLGQAGAQAAPGFGVTVRVLDRTRAPTWLGVFGVDRGCALHWLVPAWDDPTEDPPLRRFAGEAPLVELPEGLRPDVPPGPFLLVAVESQAPLGVKAIEAALAECAAHPEGAARLEGLQRLGLRTTHFPILVEAE